MNRPDNTHIFQQVTAYMNDLYKRKNTAYGDSFSRSVQKYGLIAALTRISDKFNRLETLLLNPNIAHNDEKVSDTLLDLASYCVMTLMEMDKDNNK